MQYKSIVLEMIRDRPELYESLRSSKRLLTAMEAYAGELREMHQELRTAVARRQPGSDPNQIAAEALEMAIGELQDRLPSA
jgi:hypothetical protein